MINDFQGVAIIMLER